MRRLTRLLATATALALLAALPAPAQSPPAQSPPAEDLQALSEAYGARIGAKLRAGDAGGAEAEMLALIALHSDRHGPAAPETLELIEANAVILERSGLPSLALRRMLYERSAAAFGPTHPQTLSALGWLAMQAAAAEAPDAAELAARSAAANRQVLGPEHEQTRLAELNLAQALRASDPPAALAALLDLAARFEGATGDDRVGRLLTLADLGALQAELGAADEALATLAAASAVGHEVLGPEATKVLEIDLMRAEILMGLGRFDEAGPLLDRAAGVLAREGDPAAQDRLDLARELIGQGRREEAAAVVQEALVAALRNDRADPVMQMTALAQFSELLDDLEMPEFEVEMRREILARLTEIAGPDARPTLQAMTLLGQALARTGDMKESLRLREAALAGFERTLDPEDPDLILARQHLASHWMGAGRTAEAIAATEAYLGLLRRMQGAGSIGALFAQMNLADLLRLDGRTAEAEALLRDADARLVDGPETRDLRHAVARALARVLLVRDAPAEALALLEGERDHAVAEARATGVAGGAPVPMLQRRIDIREMALLLGKAAFLTARDDPAAPVAALRARAFEDVQLVAAGTASDVIFRAAARAAAADPALRALFADWERLGEENARLRRDRLERIGKEDAGLAAGPGTDETAGGPEAGGEAAAYAALEAALRRDHPELLAMLAPPPTPLARLQGTDGRPPLLREDEALALITDFMPSRMTDPAMDFGLVWAISRDAAAWAILPLDERGFSAAIERLRESLDPQAGPSPGPDPALQAAAGPLPTVRAPVAPAGLGARAAPSEAMRPFDIPAAHDLHQALFGDPAVAEVLGAKPNWVVIAQGDALALPFNALVARLPPEGAAAGPARLRATGWLGLERGLLTLPSVAAFAALREGARPAGPPEGPVGYVAFGDPEFAPETGLPRLAGTRAEIDRIAGLDGIEPLAVALGPEASEARLAELAASDRLAAAQVLHFATHGLTVRTGEDLPEVALVLSPSAEGAAGGNGYLTAAEVARLRLSADWVLLSACNTAAWAEGGGLGLRGLTDGFFEAGARNLLVSHWRVQDDTAARLAAEAVAGSLDGLPKPEALRRAMASVAADAGRDGTELPNAHPSVWAPFLILGGGEAAADGP